jgi:hypothetical protein
MKLERMVPTLELIFDSNEFFPILLSLHEAHANLVNCHIFFQQIRAELLGISVHLLTAIYCFGDPSLQIYIHRLMDCVYSHIYIRS